MRKPSEKKLWLCLALMISIGAIMLAISLKDFLSISQSDLNDYGIKTRFFFISSEGWVYPKKIQVLHNVSFGDGVYTLYPIEELKRSSHKEKVVDEWGSQAVSVKDCTLFFCSSKIQLVDVPIKWHWETIDDSYYESISRYKPGKELYIEAYYPFPINVTRIETYGPYIIPDISESELLFDMHHNITVYVDD